MAPSIVCLSVWVAATPGCGWPGHLQAAAVLARVTDEPDPPDWYLGPVEQQRLALSILGEEVQAKLYTPVDRPRAPGIVLLHGVHPDGIDEPSFVAFASAVAAAGVAVLTPYLPELVDYRADARTLERIGAVAQAHARLVGRPRVGAIGISFAGGLVLLAAADARVGSAIGFVVAVGAHHDLSRVAAFHGGCRVRGPDGEPARGRPHPFGLGVLVRAHAERFFDTRDAAAGRRALTLWLEGRGHEAKVVAGELSPSGQALLDPLLDGRLTGQVARRLAHAVRDNRCELSRVSPRGRLGSLAVPVFLVHGEADPIIPSTETRWLATEVPEPWLRAVLITPVLRHTELPGAPSDADKWALIHFMAEVLEQASSGSR